MGTLPSIIACTSPSGACKSCAGGLGKSTVDFLPCSCMVHARGHDVVPYAAHTQPKREGGQGDDARKRARGGRTPRSHRGDTEHTAGEAAHWWLSEGSHAPFTDVAGRHSSAPGAGSRT